MWRQWSDFCEGFPTQHTQWKVPHFAPSGAETEAERFGRKTVERSIRHDETLRGPSPTVHDTSKNTAMSV